MVERSAAERDDAPPPASGECPVAQRRDSRSGQRRARFSSSAVALAEADLFSGVRRLPPSAWTPNPRSGACLLAFCGAAAPPSRVFEYVVCSRDYCIRRLAVEIGVLRPMPPPTRTLIPLATNRGRS